MAFITLEKDAGGRIMAQQRVCDLCGAEMKLGFQPNAGHPEWERGWESYDVELDGKKYELRQFFAIGGQISDACSKCFYRLNMAARTGRQGGIGL